VNCFKSSTALRRLNEYRSVRQKMLNIGYSNAHCVADEFLKELLMSVQESIADIDYKDLTDNELRKLKSPTRFEYETHGKHAPMDALHGPDLADALIYLDRYLRALQHYQLLTGSCNDQQLEFLLREKDLSKQAVKHHLRGVCRNRLDSVEPRQTSEILKRLKYGKAYSIISKQERHDTGQNCDLNERGQT